MPDLNPILLLPFERRELTRKPAGGGTQAPLIELTDQVRAQLSDRLTQIATVADSVGATPELPLPVVITLHNRALAKSNRPYALLSSANMAVQAAERRGDLVVPATGDRLRALAGKVLNARSPKELFAISTLHGLREWGVQDIAGGADALAVRQMLQSALREERTLKIALFPWMRAAVRGARRVEGSDWRRSPADDQLVPRRLDTPTRELLRVLNEAEVEVAHTIVDAGRPVLFLKPSTGTQLSSVLSLPGLRSVRLAERFSTGQDIHRQWFRQVRELSATDVDRPYDDDYPTVGVLDSGVQSAFLEPWVSGRVSFDSPRFQDATHGTFTSGLIINSQGLNAGHNRYPDDRATVYDAQVLPSAPIDEHLLLERVIEVVSDPSNAEIRVWNCSFGAERPNPAVYGEFARELDRVSAERRVLFVVAAGNYQSSPPRSWPPDAARHTTDRITSPAEGVGVLTVGARAHNGGSVIAGAPASYSRRGPNFAENVKPELCHWAGDMSADGELDGFGVQSVVPSGELAESIGTSFAAPLVSSIAANVWRLLDESGAVDEVSPELVKGLLVHAAHLSSEPIEAQYRNYYGWGVPPSSSEVLGNTDSSFTTVHAVDIQPGGVWIKEPFPVPECLLTNEGKFRGEVVLTLSYQPQIDAAFGAEAVRSDVEGSFGSFVADPSTGDLRYKKITKPVGIGGSLWEEDQIADGKWSPVKTYRAHSSRGLKGGTEWALRLAHTERVADGVSQNQRVYAIITFRSIGEPLPVYQNGVSAVRSLRYPSHAMIPSTRLRIRS